MCGSNAISSDSSSASLKPLQTSSSRGGFSNVYNIKDYGAVSNEDSTAAIQAAWDALIAGGQKSSALYIPADNYLISDTLNFRFHSFWDAKVYGDGNSSVLRWVGIGDAVKEININNKGVGCTSNPIVTIGEPTNGGIQATADYLRSTDDNTHFINVTEYGTKYSAIPSVSFSGGDCATQPKATAVLYSRKPVMRIIGALKSVFQDFRISVSDANPVATGILVETNSSSVVTRSNNFIRIRVEASTNCSVQKGIQLMAGDHVSLSFPEITNAAGIDGNNDHNLFSQIEISQYSIAAISFENTQSKVNYLEQLQADACDKARDDTLKAMVADRDTSSNSALDQGPNGRGPYGVTTSLSKGGQVGNGGSFYINGGVFHSNAIDIYQSNPNEDPLSIFGNFNSETGRRFLQVGPRGAAPGFMQPVSIRDVTWTSNQPVDDVSGIVTIGHNGPVTIRNSFFRSTNNQHLKIVIGRNDAWVDFSYNLFRWTKGSEGSVDHDPFTRLFSGPTPRLTRTGNVYVDSSNAVAFRSDELPTINGSVTLSRGKVTVKIGRKETDIKYFLQLTGNTDEKFYVTNRTKTSFDIKSSNGSSKANVDWQLSR